jgi:uncharacterized protein YrrD
MSSADLGRPVAYLVVNEGTPVYDPSGEQVGVVDEVVADYPMDIFEGLIVHTLPLPGRHLFADADQIAELHERGVLLAVPGDELSVPNEPRPARQFESDKTVESPLQARLRRAWDWLVEHLDKRR